MATTPALFAVITELVADLRATTGYGAPGTDSVIPVYDGPTPTADVNGTYVVVGADIDQGDAATVDGEWHTLGTQPHRDEDGEVACLVVSVDGSGAVATARAAVASALADLAAVAHQITTAPTTDVLVSSLRLRQEQTPTAGAVVTAQVVVRYHAIQTTWP